MRNILKEIETKYPVAEIRVNGQQVWPYLRMHYFFQYATKMTIASGERLSYSRSRLADWSRQLASSLYGAPNWFRKYDYIALSNTAVRKQVADSYFDRLLDPIIDEVGPDRVLLIESPSMDPGLIVEPLAPGHYPIKQVHTRNITSDAIPKLVAFILRKSGIKRPRIENMAVLQEIQREFGLNIDDAQAIQTFEAQRRVFSFLFRRIQPRKVILQCYYGLMPAVRAANDLGIDVVESQHGTIGKKHPAYNVYTEIDRSCFPGYLLSFGKEELKTFDNSRFIDPAHVHPVGSFYIEYVKKSFNPDRTILDRLRGYRRRIGIALGIGTEKSLIEFVCRAAGLDNTICYILIPRVLDSYLLSFNLPDNVIIIEGRNFHELMMYVDFHSTMISSCALEAPSLGVQNILINIDNRSKYYYADLLTDSRVTRFVDTPEDYLEAVNTFIRLDRKTVCRLNEDNFSPDYGQNIRNFVREYLDPSLEAGC